MSMVDMVRYNFSTKNYHGYVEIDKEENKIVSAYLVNHREYADSSGVLINHRTLVSWDTQNYGVGESRLEATYRMARRWGEKTEYRITVDEYCDLYD